MFVEVCGQHNGEVGSDAASQLQGPQFDPALP